MMSSNPVPDHPTPDSVGGAEDSTKSSETFSTKAPATENAQLAEELLPPIEPPNARFILQLFVIPAVIVLAVVLLWLLVTSLATRGEQDPDKIVQALRSSSAARWQQAKDLTNMLRLPKRYPELKQNAYLARQLAQLLDEEIDAQRTDDNSIQLRFFLCPVRGQFEVDEGLEVLLKAAREDVKMDVRRQAINALAVLAHTFNTMQEPKTLEHEDLVSTFSQLSTDKEDLIRSETAYTLGVLALQPKTDPSFTDNLILLMDDLFSDTRYNAALGLARQGNPVAAEVLVEMLDPEAIKISIAKVDSVALEEYLPALQSFKRNTILRNALDGMKVLMKKNEHLDRQPLLNALKQFVEGASSWQVAGELPKELVEYAQNIQQQYAGAPLP